METTLKHPCHVNIEKALKDLDDYSASQLDRDVFTYIAEWVNRRGETWPCSPCLRSIANAVGKCTVTVSKSVHRLEEWGLLEIGQGYFDEDEHPRNMYAIPRRYLLDTSKDTEDSVQAEASASAPKNSGMQNEPGNIGRSDDILCKLADLLADYQKKQDILSSGIREAEDYAERFRGGQDYLAAATLRRVADFLDDALKQ